MTEFGLLLSELMRARGITEPGELSVQLTGAGYWFTEDTVRDYMSGRVERPDPAFGRGVAEVLRLNEEERRTWQETSSSGMFDQQVQKRATKLPLVKPILAGIYPQRASRTLTDSARLGSALAL